MRSSGSTYNEIVEKLGCSRGTISYHCGEGQKEKSNRRRIKNRSNQHPFVRKVENFKSKTKDKKNTFPTHETKKLIQLKIETFCLMYKSKTFVKPDFTVEDVLDKVGDNPVCYLTGDSIDISKPRTYSFDHITPRSRGGTNGIDNLGLCTKVANQAKSNMTPDEFFLFCKKVVEHNSI